MAVERALTSPEDIVLAAAADLADKFTAVARPTDDLLERHSVPDERQIAALGVLAPQIALISQPFRTGQQLRVDRRRADRGTDHTHGAAHRVKEGCARVLHQVPAVCDLDGIRQRLVRGLAIPAAAIARHDPDRWELGKPSLHRCLLTVGQQRHDPPPLQIADDCSVAIVPAEGPVIDARNDQRLAPSAGSSADDPQQGVVADG